MGEQHEPLPPRPKTNANRPPRRGAGSQMRAEAPSNALSPRFGGVMGSERSGSSVSWLTLVKAYWCLRMIAR